MTPICILTNFLRHSLRALQVRVRGNESEVSDRGAEVSGMQKLRLCSFSQSQECDGGFASSDPFGTQHLRVLLTGCKKALSGAALVLSVGCTTPKMIVPPCGPALNSYDMDHLRANVAAEMYHRGMRSVGVEHAESTCVCQGGGRVKKYEHIPALR